MCHDVNMEFLFNIFKNKTTELFPANNKWCKNIIKPLAWHKSETKCHLKMIFALILTFMRRFVWK